MKERPLVWLDYFQENHKKTLLQDFGPDVNLLEELINLVSQCVEEINVALPDSDLQQLYESKDEKLLCATVSGILLYESIERLHAARSLLLLGYQGRMLACLRDMIESLYYSDVCMKNPQEARHWLDNGYINKDTATKVHQVVERNRKGQMWNLLSGAGVHPLLATRLSSTRYKTSSLGDFRGDPHAVDTKNARRKKDYHNTRLNILVAMNVTHDFVLYLHETYSRVCHENAEIYSMMERLEKEYHARVKEIIDSIPTSVGDQIP